MRRILIVLLTGVAVACSDETSTLDTGVDDSKQVRDLTTDDIRQICDAVVETTRAFAENNQDGTCRLAAGIAGLVAGEFGQDGVMVCEESLAACMPQEIEQPECELEVTTECSVTVGELETCFNDALGELQRLYDDLGSRSCMDLVTGNLDFDLDEPASCETLDARCPGIDFDIDG